MSRRFLLVILLLGITAGGCEAELHAGGPSRAARSTWAVDTEDAWTAMHQQLVGQFRAVTPESRTINTSYRLVSKDSALVETFTSASGKETISVYHRDGPSLMLTHYCAQGNQARLKAIEATRDHVVFTFLDATNVNAEQSVMRRLAFTFRPDGFDQETMYRDASGVEDTTTLHFIRQTLLEPPLTK